jgi:hypothetical protein
MYMSFCNRVVLPIFAAVSLAFLVACSSSSHSITPPPTGAFSNSNLNGTYVFSTQGVDATNGTPLTIVGAFTACGCTGGTISGGNFTWSDPGFSPTFGPGASQTINSGTYSVGQDGRGTATLETSVSSPFNTIELDFVLSTNSGGTVTLFEPFGTGSGTLEAQTPVAQSDIAQGYAYLVSGENADGTITSAGAFTLGASGTFTGQGSYDVTTYNFTTLAVGGLANATLSADSTVTVGSGTVPGSASITDTSNNTYLFDVYAVSASDLKFVEIDGNIFGAGDAFPQATALPSGTLAYTMNGLDPSGAPLSMGGLLPFSSGAITAGIQDYNDGGTQIASNTSVGGGFNNPLSGGRATLQLTSFFDGSSVGNGTYGFAAYPTTNGTLLLEIDGSGITSGSALTQTNTSMAATQGYGMNVSATNLTGSSPFEEDDIAEFVTSTSSFTGSIDINDEGTTTSPSSPPLFAGDYSSISTGRYTLAANSTSNFNGMSGVVYTVDGQTLLFVEGDTFQVGTGVLQVQNASGSDAQAATRHVAVFPRILPAKNAAKWHKQTTSK